MAAERLGLLDNTSFSNRERWVVGERISMGCFLHFAAGKGFSERINSRSYVVFEAQTPKPVMRLFGHLNLKCGKNMLCQFSYFKYEALNETTMENMRLTKCGLDM